MSPSEIIMTTAAYAALIAWVSFGVCYDRVKWWKSPEGRNIMTLTVSLCLLVAVIALNRFIPWADFKYLTVAFALTVIAITGVWRTHQLRMAQKARKARLEASENETRKDVP